MFGEISAALLTSGSKRWAQGDINAGKKAFCMDKVMYLSMRCAFYILGILHLLSAIIEPPRLDIWDSQDVSFLASGNVSYHHTPAGSAGL